MSTYRWKPEAAEKAADFGLTRADVEAVADSPQFTTDDPSNIRRDWHTTRRRSGDVTVVVAEPPGREPIIWGVYLHLPVDASGRGESLGPTPRSDRELRKRIANCPDLRVVPATNHDRVIDVETGRQIIVLSRGGKRDMANSRHVLNNFASLRRAGYSL